MKTLKKINTVKKAGIVELYANETTYNCSICGKAIPYYVWKEHGGLCAECDTDYKK